MAERLNQRMASLLARVRRLLQQLVLQPEPGPKLQLASGQGLARAVKLRNYPLPPEFVAFVTTFAKGSACDPGGKYGVANGDGPIDALTHLEWSPPLRDRDWLPVAGDGSGGTYVLNCRSRADGLNPVYYVDPDEREGDDAFAESEGAP